MSWPLVTLIATVLVASYLATLSSALLMMRRAAVLKRLDDSGREADGRWLMDNLDPTTQAVALFRTAARLSCLALILVHMVVGSDSETALPWQRVVVAVLIAVSVLWLFTTVLANALARYTGTPLLVHSLPMLKSLHYAAYPLTKMFSFVDEAVRRLAGANLRDEEEEAEAELLQRIEESQRKGGLDEDAAALMENVVEFTSTDVGEVMTPRTDIEGIELTDDLAIIRDFIAGAGHSRIPVYRDSLDDIVGLLYVKDLVPYLGADASTFTLQPILRPPTLVPETKQVRELLSDFQRQNVHIAIVIDEYGGTAGLVTIEDVLEEIVGEIHDEHEPDNEEEPSFRTIDATHAEVDGRYPINDFNEHLNLDLPEDEDFDTIGGFVLARLGRVPDVGESFEFDGARFTTIAATQRHIQRLAVELLETAAKNGED